MAIRANRKMPPSQRTAISPSPSAPPRHATPSNSETRKCYTQQVSPCLNGRHGSPQRLSNFGWRSVSYQEAPETLIFLLCPSIAIFCHHDSRYFFAFSPNAHFLNETYCGRYLVACCRGHPIVCRCCNLCPKSRGRKERLARLQGPAFHFPFTFSPGSARRIQ